MYTGPSLSVNNKNQKKTGQTFALSHCRFAQSSAIIAKFFWGMPPRFV